MGHHALELKTALVGALRLAELGVDGLPIPGVKGCISGILKIIEQEELRRDNLETFEGLCKTITEFRTVTIERLSQKGNLSEDVRRDMQDLAEKLIKIPEQYTKAVGDHSKMNPVKGFFFASDHAQALNKLGTDLKDAMESFRTRLLVNIQAAEEKREADRLFDKLTPAVERKAPFNAYRKHEIELCEPGTRVSLLMDVTEWAEGEGLNHEQRILWLNGRAGVGKSTIAQTLATRLHALKILGGSFMFSKPNGVTDGSRVFTTIAYQLARHLPAFRDQLVAAIRAKEDSIHANIREQFEDLLAMPLSQLQSPPPTLIILDALDECSPETLPAMLTLLVANMSHFPFLRLLITSRPELSIQQVLRRFTEHIHEVDLNDVPASEDITTYLQRRLSSMYCRLVGDSDENQVSPTEDNLAALVRMADNLFVFAATVVRFIGDEMAADPQPRLEVILHGRHVSRKNPFATLDVVYQEILRNALPDGEDDIHRRFRDVVGFIALAFESPSFNSLISFLQSTYSTSSVRHLLNSLRSVLVVPEKDDKVGLQVYHKSFADFITDPKRCTQMSAYVRSSIHYARICNWYFKIAAVQHSQEVRQFLHRHAHFTDTGMSHKQALNNLSRQLFNLLSSIHQDCVVSAASEDPKSNDDYTIWINLKTNAVTRIPVDAVNTDPGWNQYGTLLLTVTTYSPVSEVLVYKQQVTGAYVMFTASIISDDNRVCIALEWTANFELGN